MFYTCYLFLAESNGEKYSSHARSNVVTSDTFPVRARTSAISFYNANIIFGKYGSHKYMTPSVLALHLQHDEQRRVQSYASPSWDSILNLSLADYSLPR